MGRSASPEGTTKYTSAICRAESCVSSMRMRPISGSLRSGRTGILYTAARPNGAVGRMRTGPLRSERCGRSFRRAAYQSCCRVYSKPMIITSEYDAAVFRIFWRPRDHPRRDLQEVLSGSHRISGAEPRIRARLPANALLTGSALWGPSAGVSRGRAGGLPGRAPPLRSGVPASAERLRGKPASPRILHAGRAGLLHLRPGAVLTRRVRRPSAYPRRRGPCGAGGGTVDPGVCPGTPGTGPGYPGSRGKSGWATQHPAARASRPAHRPAPPPSWMGWPPPPAHPPGQAMTSTKS